MTRYDLWRVVRWVCVPLARFSVKSPCADVVYDEQSESGYAVLAISPGHILTVPTKRIIGLESRDLLKPGLPNYWQAAWEQRSRLEKGFGRQFDRSDIALAINSAKGRSQDQFHIHTACIRPDVKAFLSTWGSSFGPYWSRTKVRMMSMMVSVMWVDDVDLRDIDVLSLFGPEVRSDEALMARQTVVVVGGWSSGKPGFFVLNAESDRWSGAHGEMLLDFSCAV